MVVFRHAFFCLRDAFAVSRGGSRVLSARVLAAAADVTSAAVRSAGRERPWALASREICNKQGEVPVFAMHAACERARFGRHGRGDAGGVKNVCAVAHGLVV